MRIAAVVEEFPVLSETFILNQITGLIDRGHAVDLFAFGQRDDSQAHEDVIKYKLLENVCYAKPLVRSRVSRMLSGLGICFSNLSNAPAAALGAMNFCKYGKHAGSMRLIHEAAPFFDAKPYDIVHAHFGQVGARVARLRKLGLLQGKFFTTFYGFDISQRIKIEAPGYYNELFDEADHIFALSEVMRDQIIKQGCPEDKVKVHHLGADSKRFDVKLRTLEQGEAVRIISVARLAEKKGLEYAIRAIAQVKARTQQPIAYTIIGDGPLREPLTNLINELDVSDVVILAGWKKQDEVVTYLNDAHLFLAPSVTAKGGDQEGTPTAIAEAMLMGLPVISTLHSGIPEMVRSGQNGFLVPERDVEGLASAILTCADSPNMWKSMGEAGRNLAMDHFDIHRLNDQLVDHYQAAL